LPLWMVGAPAGSKAAAVLPQVTKHQRRGQFKHSNKIKAAAEAERASQSTRRAEEAQMNMLIALHCQ
jgi:transposase